MTFTRTHIRVTFANPFLICGKCGARADGFHDPERCGCTSDFHLEPCGHAAEALDTCPSWGPVEGCRCADPTTEHRRAPETQDGAS